MIGWLIWKIFLSTHLWIYYENNKHLSLHANRKLPNYPLHSQSVDFPTFRCLSGWLSGKDLKMQLFLCPILLLYWCFKLTTTVSTLPTNQDQVGKGSNQWRWQPGDSVLSQLKIRFMSQSYWAQLPVECTFYWQQQPHSRRKRYSGSRGACCRKAKPSHAHQWILEEQLMQVRWWGRWDGNPKGSIFST